MKSQFKLVKVKGKEILPYIEALSKLRIEIFKEFPYLYIGDMEYEKKYLNTYSTCPESFAALVLDNEQVVGATTAIPLKFETEECQKPFIDNSMNINEIFYLGESVLLQSHRGLGIYKTFFEARETAACEYGCKITTFCAVERPWDHPRRPKDYVPLDEVWQHFGYQKISI